MKTLSIISFFLISVLSAPAQQFSAFFRYEKGPRIDFSAATPKGASSEDGLPESAVLHILIPKEGNTAQVSLTYGKTANDREDQSYAGVVVHRTADMISIICVFGDQVDKIENLVIFPKKGVGFYISHSAYLGSEVMKAIAAEKAEIPYGSASIFRLRQFKE